MGDAQASTVRREEGINLDAQSTILENKLSFAVKWSLADFMNVETVKQRLNIKRGASALEFASD
jgi:hypothetical protein